MNAGSSHTWVIAPYRHDRDAALDAMLTTGERTERETYVVDCHRNRRGPYSGTGDLLRQLVPAVAERWPELAEAHATELLSIAPELRGTVRATAETLTSLAIPEERTRFYSRLRTLRLAHGVVNFLLEYVARAGGRALSIRFEQAQAADTLDQEFIAVLLRRARPEICAVCVGTATATLPAALQTALTRYAVRHDGEPLAPPARQRLLDGVGVPAEWGRWLNTHSAGWRGEWEPLKQVAAWPASPPPDEASLDDGLRALIAEMPEARRSELAHAYVLSDGTTDSLLEQHAYTLADEVQRQAWHETRAEELEAADEWSLRLGAIPYHRERGGAPAISGAKALQAALDYCINMGFYEATVDLGTRGRGVIDWQKQPELYWIFTTKMTTSLAALERPAEAEALYIEARALSSKPRLHMQAAYATAMLYTRHHAPERQDHLLAKGWINEAIAIAELLPDPKERAFNTVFNQNGLALIEGHLGHPQEAIRLVTEGLDRLNRELEPGEHLLHRSVLRYNRAQVYGGLRQWEQAIADYSAVIEQDPHYSEYHLDRGNLYRRMGRNEEALADYDAAIRFSPPYPEAYYNRAGALSTLERFEEALDDYTTVITLDPAYRDAYINRATIFYERGELSAARQDVTEGLALDEENAALLCTLGLIEMAQDHLDAAEEAFARALSRDPSLLAAWTNHAVLAVERGDADRAIADLTAALAIREDADVLYNRGWVYQSQGEWEAAITDYARALSLPGADTQELLYQRGLCYLAEGDATAGRRDLEAHLAGGPSLHADEIRERLLVGTESGVASA